MNANLARLWQAFMEATTPTRSEQPLIRIKRSPAEKLHQEYEAHKKDLTDGLDRAIKKQKKLLQSGKSSPKQRTAARLEIERYQKALAKLNKELEYDLAQLQLE